MHRVSLARRAGAILLAMSMLLASAGFTWAVADDWTVRDVVPPGVRLGSLELGGMTRARALEVVEQQVAAPLLAPVQVTSENGTYTLEPQDMLSVDIEGMVEAALNPKRRASLPERVYRRVSGAPVEAEVSPMLKVDEVSLGRWVEKTASSVDRRPVDSTIVVTPKGLRFTPSVTGLKTKPEESVQAISAALLAGTKSLGLSVTEIRPAVTEDDWGKSILVIKSQRTLYLYKGTKLEKKYPIAVGTPGWPTPSGNFKIVNKRYRPSWSNPHSSWSANMPEYIPPGPGNPLGTRALDLDAAGIRIHGTSKDWSIGTAASHGCMRMHMWDVEDLFPRVPVGTRVIIVR